MARRLPDATIAGDEPPAWISCCVEDDWVHTEDETHPMVAEFGAQLTRSVLAHGRWAAARREWASEQGVSLRDLPRARGPR